MKQVLEFLKALGAFVLIFGCIVLCVLGIIGELFPTILPDWLWYVFGIPGCIVLFICLPVWALIEKRKK